jgi:hypothetical protein
MAVFLSGTRAHLDENEDPMIIRHQIDLALRPAPIALQNSQPALFEQTGRQGLSLRPESCSIRKP